MGYIKDIFDKKLLKFILVGGINTLVGTFVMFGAYNFFGFSYWISSALNYIIGSIVSYFLNRNFTFRSKISQRESIPRFVINIAICYVIAYGFAKPVVRILFQNFTGKQSENTAMLVGMCLFVGINYIGQRFFVFKRNDEK